MPEFYTIFARKKYFLPEFGGATAPLCPPSPTPMVVDPLLLAVLDPLCPCWWSRAPKLPNELHYQVIKDSYSRL